MSGDKRTGQLRILSSLSTFFPPTYKDVGNSERLFTVGDSAAYLSSDVRDILFSGTWSADLSNAHLVIAARLWGLDDLLGVIEEKGSIWPYLMTELQLPTEKKPELKTAIYATVYGKPVPSTEGCKLPANSGKEVTALLHRTADDGDASSEEGSAIWTSIRSSCGGITDAYGQFRALCRHRRR